MCGEEWIGLGKTLDEIQARKCHGLQMVDTGIKIAEDMGLTGSAAIAAVLGHIRNRDPDIVDTLKRLLKVVP